MPIYVYGCRKCGSLLERLVLTAAEIDEIKANPPRCPLDGRKMDKLPGRSAVRFVGTGWATRSPSGGAKLT